MAAAFCDAWRWSQWVMRLMQGKKTSDWCEQFDHTSFYKLDGCSFFEAVRRDKITAAVFFATVKGIR